VRGSSIVSVGAVDLVVRGRVAFEAGRRNKACKGLDTVPSDTIIAGGIAGRIRDERDSASRIELEKRRDAGDV
jgi:hypothetical protein